MNAVSVLGAGSWGTALAVLLAPQALYLWSRSAARARAMQESRRNEAYLPGILLPDSIEVGSSLAAALTERRFLVLATPSHAVRNLAQKLLATQKVSADTILVNTSKGLEEGTGLRMSEVLRQELSSTGARIVSLVGPSHAEEVARGMPTTVVVAGEDESVCTEVQQLFTTAWFRVYTNTDLVGTELAVSVKNVIAIAAGICDGLGFGDNSRGALLTRGLAEMARLGMAMGAQSETFSGLAGLGDLVTTATSRHSRNRNLGEAMAAGKTLQEALALSKQVCEGVRTTPAVLELAKRHGVEMPITLEVEQILFHGKDPRRAIRDLMLRTPKPESWSTSRGVS